MLSLIENPWVLFPVLLVGLTFAVEAGLRLRHAAPAMDEGRQSLIASARDGLSVLLSLLLGFSLPMALPHYEQRRQLVTDEANAIATVDQRAQMSPEPFRSNILKLLPEYINARLEFAKGALNGHTVLAAMDHAKHVQREMLEQTVMLVQQNPNVVTPLFVQSIGSLGDLMELRLAAAEKRIPNAIWLVLILISVLTCFVVGFSMEHRLLLAMFVVPLTVAIILALVAELDSARSGFIHAEQLSMERLQQDLRMEVAPAP